MSKVKRVPPKISAPSPQTPKGVQKSECFPGTGFKLDFTNDIPLSSDRKSIMFADLPGIPKGPGTKGMKSILFSDFTPVPSVKSEPRKIVLNKLDSWIPEKTEYRRPIIVGYTVAGMYKRLPTERRAPISSMNSSLTSGPLSARRIHQIREQSLPTLKISSSIPFSSNETEGAADLGSSTGNVEENIRLSDVIKNKHAKLRNEFISCPEVENIVTEEEFHDILLIYENNQVYYQQCYDDKKIDYEKMIEKLICLERWFICIIEPKPYKKSEIPEWMEREKMKLINGYSEYCDPDVIKYFKSEDLFDEKIVKYIKMWHAKLAIK